MPISPTHSHVYDTYIRTHPDGAIVARCQCGHEITFHLEDVRAEIRKRMMES